MKQLIHKLFIFLLTLLLFTSIPMTTYADENFTTAYDVTYTVAESGETTVQMKIKLTNNTSQYYASSYKVELGFDDIRNLRGSDPEGALSPELEKTKNGNIIDVTFNKKSVGINTVLPFTVTFETKNVAQKQGNIWAINIPGVAKQENFSAFDVRVVVPESFGTASFIKPATEDRSLTFTKELLGKSGISIAFGDQQQFSYTLTYHLRNNNLFPIKTEIALPPTTGYQDSAIKKISPEPLNVTVDSDGNWIAEYYLLPSRKIDVTVTGLASLYLEPRKEPITPEQKVLYTRPQRYWETQSTQIKKLAKELQTPEKIYEYVVSTLSYDYSRVTDRKARVGAASVLVQPTSAVCLEFTDLFIAIARAAGIPAREVDGYAYTANAHERPLSLISDILHSWPEYYDENKQQWIMIDPTWGKTTNGIDYFNAFDLDHLTFVKRGKDSTYPIPAGGYKYEEDQPKKDVVVAFTSEKIDAMQQFSIIPTTKEYYLPGFPITARMTIVNTGSLPLSHHDITVHAGGLTPLQQKVTVEPIPPFGKRAYLVHFDPTSFLTNKKSMITIQVADQTIKKEIVISPMQFSQWEIIGGITVALLTFIVLITTITTRRLPVFRQKQHHTVRRESKRS